MSHPRFSSPRRADAGTRTSWKVIRLNSWMSSTLGMTSISKPGSAVSTRKMVMPAAA